MPVCCGCLLRLSAAAVCCGCLYGGRSLNPFRSPRRIPPGTGPWTLDPGPWTLDPGLSWCEAPPDGCEAPPGGYEAPPGRMSASGALRDLRRRAFGGWPLQPLWDLRRSVEGVLHQVLPNKQPSQCLGLPEPSHAYSYAPSRVHTIEQRPLRQHAATALYTLYGLVFTWVRNRMFVSSCGGSAVVP